MMVVFVTDESVDRDFRRRRSRFQAVHHQLRTASNFWEIGTDLRSANQGY
jgi:hypothetical protein